MAHGKERGMKKIKPGDRVKVFIAISGKPIETVCIVLSINKLKMLEVATEKAEHCVSTRVFWAHPKQVEVLKWEGGSQY